VSKLICSLVNEMINNYHSLIEVCKNVRTFVFQVYESILITL
jgi:hypothetical protein